MAEIAYIIDIILGFNTSYFEVISGDEIVDRKLITKNYISGGFILDVLSVTPIIIIPIAEYMEENNIGSNFWK
jgi:hypothetical protein